jgi:hypothetical protein
MTSPYDRAAVSNGQPREQTLIRRWWQEKHGGRGRLVWEYYLGDCYLDAMWFPDVPEEGAEFSGKRAAKAFPIAGQSVVLCEAKVRLTPELVGQALLYGALARRAGADVRGITIFAESAKPAFVAAASDLGLEVVVTPE